MVLCTADILAILKEGPTMGEKERQHGLSEADSTSDREIDDREDEPCYDDSLLESDHGSPASNPMWPPGQRTPPQQKQMKTGRWSKSEKSDLLDVIRSCEGSSMKQLTVEHRRRYGDRRRISSITSQAFRMGFKGHRRRQSRDSSSGSFKKITPTTKSKLVVLKIPRPSRAISGQGAVVDLPSMETTDGQTSDETSPDQTSVENLHDGMAPISPSVSAYEELSAGHRIDQHPRSHGIHQTQGAPVSMRYLLN